MMDKDDFTTFRFKAYKFCSKPLKATVGQALIVALLLVLTTCVLSGCSLFPETTKQLRDLPAALDKQASEELKKKLKKD